MSRKPLVTLSALFGLFCGLSLALVSPGAAAALPPEAQAKVDQALKQLSGWAADPAVVAAVKEANAKGPIAGMNNAKWDELTAADAQVTAILNGPVSKQLAKWDEDKAINKLYLRDQQGNLVAGSNKPLLYNVAARPAFKEGIKGPWVDADVKPDPTTQLKSVQVATPVMEGGKAIGLLHSAVTIE